MQPVQRGLLAAGLGMAVNILLPIARIATGIVEIHVEADGALTVRCGHEIGHGVSDGLKSSSLSVLHGVVHIEPAPTRGPD